MDTNKVCFGNDTVKQCYARFMGYVDSKDMPKHYAPARAKIDGKKVKGFVVIVNSEFQFYAFNDQNHTFQTI